MSVVALSKESHKNPQKFRIKYEDAQAVLGPNAKVPKNDELPTISSSSKIAIIGGGFSGLASALTCINDLKEDDFVVFDKHDNYGGTWYANTYPGCASDIPAVWYSLFNELNSTWSAVQPPQYEMQEYCLSLVKKYNLYKYSRFETTVTELRYNDEDANWTISLRNKSGQLVKHTAKIVINCQGALVHPNQLNVPGLEDFKGEYMHSAIWDHSVSFKGMKVTVVGNGCSANQVIPALLRQYEPESLTQVVRSRHYIMPPVPRFVQFIYKLLSFSRPGIILIRWLIAAFAEARWPLFKGDGLLTRFVRWVNTKQSLMYMKRVCPEKFQDKVIPSFKIGCKRLIFDHSYLPSLHDPRVDVTNEDIDHIEEHAVVMKNGDRIETDILVACTGYNLVKSFSNYNIIGRDGLNLTEVWLDEGASAYETTLLRDCPNFFMIGGPNSATGHSSVVLAIENGCKYVTKVVPKVLSGQYKSVCVKTKSYYNWFHNTQKELAKAVYGTPFGGCVSWYTKGGINFTTYPYSQITYWWRMRHPKWNDLEYEPNYDWSKAGSKAKFA